MCRNHKYCLKTELIKGIGQHFGEIYLFTLYLPVKYEATSTIWLALLRVNTGKCGNSCPGFVTKSIYE